MLLNNSAELSSNDGMHRDSEVDTADSKWVVLVLEG